ncbi:hypothetical protein [Streptomyces sp. NPDC053560]
MEQRDRGIAGTGRTDSTVVIDALVALWLMTFRSANIPTSGLLPGVQARR